jgi:ABC-type glycerol-3-phosphate transport system substrate-binding protein
MKRSRYMRLSLVALAAAAALAACANPYAGFTPQEAWSLEHDGLVIDTSQAFAPANDIDAHQLPDGTVEITPKGDQS